MLTSSERCYMIITYMCKSCGCSSRSKNFGNVERFIEPCILLLLSQKPSHGYGLMEDLEHKCGEKVDIGNLYRTLRRMEMDGWVKSDWSKNESGPDRRTYTITQDGLDFLKSAVSSLVRTEETIQRLLKGYREKFKEEKVSI